MQGSTVSALTHTPMHLGTGTRLRIGPRRLAGVLLRLQPDLTSRVSLLNTLHPISDHFLLLGGKNPAQQGKQCDARHESGQSDGKVFGPDLIRDTLRFAPPVADQHLIPHRGSRQAKPAQGRPGLDRGATMRIECDARVGRRQDRATRSLLFGGCCCASHRHRAAAHPLTALQLAFDGRRDDPARCQIGEEEVVGHQSGQHGPDCDAEPAHLENQHLRNGQDELTHSRATTTRNARFK